MFQIVKRFGAGALALALTVAPASAACHVAGDSIAVGLGRILGGCTTNAKVGIPAAAVVARAAAGRVDYLVVSAGSNDFPRGLPAIRYARAKASVEAALARIHAGRGGAEMIIVLPANGARPVVAAWAATERVRTVSFAAGPDGLHPASYPALGRAVLAAMSAGS